MKIRCIFYTMKWFAAWVRENCHSIRGRWLFAQIVVAFRVWLPNVDSLRPESCIFQRWNTRRHVEHLVGWPSFSHERVFHWPKMVARHQHTMGLGYFGRSATTLILNKVLTFIPWLGISIDIFFTHLEQRGLQIFHKETKHAKLARIQVFCSTTITIRHL